MPDKKHTFRSSVSPDPSGRFIPSSQRSTESVNLICQIFSQYKSRQENLELKFFITNYKTKFLSYYMVYQKYV